MRPTFLALLLLVPAIALGQSLGEVAKREKDRRDKNKEQGRDVRVFSETEIFPEEEEDAAEGSEEGEASSSSPRSNPPRRPSPTDSESDEGYDEGYGDGEDDDGSESEPVPKRIPPEAPLEQKLELFQRMKRHYERQVKQLDKAIAENEEQMRQLDAKIRETSTVGGAGGPPVRPQMPSGDTVNRQLTGQESQQFKAERDQLQKVNAGLVKRKERLKLDLQTKGRVAGIPAGYLRF